MPDPLAHVQEQLRQDQKLLDTIKVHLPALEQLVEMLEYDYEDRMYRFYYQSFKVYELQSFTTQALDVLQQIAHAIDRPLSPWFTEITAQGLGVHFAVNISGQSIGDDAFPGYLEDKLKEYRVPPSLISFELTETAAVTNIVRAEALMRRLRDMGHEIALDDFGRGLSSLTYLQSLPASFLKIDGALVRDVVDNPRAQAMISAIVQLASAMKLKTTAECVESEAIELAVNQLGVHYGQGFHIGRPRALEAVLKDLLAEASGGASVSVIMKGISRLAG